MKRCLYILLMLLVALTGCKKQIVPEGGGDTGGKTGGDSGGNDAEITQVVPSPAVWDGQKRADITYQLLLYSFADGGGDATGDLKGLTQHLDYIDALGASAVWLSPIHPSPSYHGYDVTDYTAINPAFGTEDDFKDFLDKAHSLGIKVYLDFVLNHTSTSHEWFSQAVADENSPYRDYYIFSEDPQADIKAGKIPMLGSEGASAYDAGQWFQASSGQSQARKVKFTLNWGTTPTLTIEEVESIVNSGAPVSGKYLWWGDSQCTQFYSSGNNVYTLSLELDSSWGVLIRTSTTTWDGGTKYGAASSGNRLSWGQPLALTNVNPGDILLPGMRSFMFHSHFNTASFADLNYGAVGQCEDSPAFKAVTAAADKWIEAGVDGFRLDAVKHIYHNAYNDENPRFLKAFHEHCDRTWKARGGKGEFYIVGEMYDDAEKAAPYYKGIPALFEFSFWYRLEWAINNGTGCWFVKDINGYQQLYSGVRTDYIEATKLTNHDEDRAASQLGKSIEKEKLAAAVLLTAAGAPYIYQGEELGYWGTKNGGDEYVRTPVLWDKAGADLASGALHGKVDKSMLTSAISVEAQEADSGSLLQTYRTFASLRNTYPSLASGKMTPHGTYNSDNQSVTALSVWYRTQGSEKMLVVHNFSGKEVTATFNNDDLSKPVALQGSASVKKADGKQSLTLGAYSTVLFLQ